MVLRRSLLAVLLVTAGRAWDARADLYWDANGTSAGGSNSDTAPGAWGADNFWSSDPSGAAVTGPWVADEIAVFAADANVTGTYDVAVSGAQSASGIRFEEGTVTLNGGTINLVNAAEVNVATGLTATIGSALGGSAGLLQSGSGTLVLTGANTYSGNTMLASNPLDGTFNIMRLGAPDVIPDASVVQILGRNSIFELNGQTETVKSIASVGAGAGAFANSRIDVGAGTLIIADDLGQTETYQAPLFAGSTGRIVKTGAGQLNISSSNSGWEGELVLSGGLLGIGVNNALGTASSGTAKLTLDGGTITFFNAGSRSIQTQNVDITNSFTALMGASNMELLGLASGGEGSVIITLKTDNPTITVDNVTGTTGTFIFRGPLGDEGQDRGFTKAGPGTLTLNNPGNTYGGDTMILSGQLRIDGNATLGDGTGTVHLSGGNLVTTGNRDPSTDPVPNPINVTADAVIATTRQLDDAVEVDFTSNSISGTGGTLTFRNDATGTANPDNQFEPRFSGSGFNFSRPIVIAEGLNDPVNRTTRLNSANASGTQTFSGEISGPGSFRRMVDGGTTVLTAANSYSGGTDVEGGILTVSGAGAILGGGDVTVTGGSLDISSGVANAIANTATLSISGTGMVNLGAGVNDIIAVLSLGGVDQASGTYGSSASSATFKLDQYFSGPGILTVQAAASFAADFDNDSDVDSDDLNAWKSGFGAGTTKGQGDADADLDVDGADFLAWQRQLGSGASVAAVAAVPEPSAAMLAVFAFIATSLRCGLVDPRFE
ncbi:MAG TPA: autotransporter-associated beta strand repeat-containing protein [Lacipirellula sp.]